MAKLWDQKILISLIDSCNKLGVYTHGVFPEKQPQRYPPYWPRSRYSKRGAYSQGGDTSRC